MLNRMSGDYTDVVRSTVTGDVSLTYEERKRLLEQELMEEEFPIYKEERWQGSLKRQTLSATSGRTR